MKLCVRVWVCVGVGVFSGKELLDNQDARAWSR